MHKLWSCLFLIAVLASSPLSAEESQSRRPPGRIKEFPREAYEAIEGFVLAEEITAELVAAEPMLVNPVAFCVDHQGRFFVCESHRLKRGVEDNRDHEEWVDDDLAAQTVDDRRSYLRKHLGDKLTAYTTHSDRLRLLVDRNDNGIVDRSQVFAEDFRDVVDGTGAGVLHRKGTVYYACIPKLYAFRDDDGDGKADRTRVIHEGFGVRTAFFGHDLHGLCLGLDGRLYVSLGDRGLNVETADGRLVNPESGAVLRCELDGSRLELFATGLRNPQGLAIDDYGNLFTGDNNSDSGDLARWVHVLEGSDSGWRMAYQYLADRGPWNRERLWEPHFADQPAYIVPPVANIADGPAGIASYPGTGLPAAYGGNFFLTDFRGEANLSGVRTFKLKPKGASFELIEPEIFLWNCLATDIKFGPDGSLYVLDWVAGWNLSGKGRIYRLSHPQAREEDRVAEVRQLLARGMRELTVTQLAKLLAHPDRRVRLEAQLELALRGAIPSLQQVADESELRLARLHAVWGLGQVARATDEEAAKDAQQALLPLLRDVDSYVRAAAAKVLGERAGTDAGENLRELLSDPAPHVQYAAALSLGKLRRKDALEPLLEMIAKNGAADPAVRHAGILGLTGCGTEPQLARLAEHEDLQVRLAAVVALRRLGSSAVSDFLADPDELVVREAARAIYDAPLVDAYPQLAALVSAGGNADDLLRRALNANYRLGRAEHAEALAVFAADADRPLARRREALTLLALWQTPVPRDRVLGMWRPVTTQRNADDVIAAVEQQLPQLIASGLEIRSQAARLAGQLGISAAAELLTDLLWSEQADTQRAGALLALANVAPDNLREVVARALSDDSPRVRAAARVVLARTHPGEAVPVLAEAVRRGEVLERQSAVAMLANVQNEAADQLLLEMVDALVKGRVPAPLRLDIFVAANHRAAASAQIKARLEDYLQQRSADDPLAPYRDTISGGNADRGKLIFHERLSVACLRCHQVRKAGGRVGPELSTIGRDKTREYLLTSIVAPDQDIAEGFETLLIETIEGKIISGIVQRQDARQITLMTADGELVPVDRANVSTTSRGKSTMPDDLIRNLTLFDLRDLIEYLSQLK